jgi:hypothetical protein
MGNPIVRGVLAGVAVVLVVLGLKLFGLSPDDVFFPRSETQVSTPFGSWSVSSERSFWLRPLLLAHILSVPALWRLCSRLGYTGWFSLAMLVPLANILLLYFLAFAEWPTGQRAPVRGGPGDTLIYSPGSFRPANLESSQPEHSPSTHRPLE